MNKAFQRGFVVMLVGFAVCVVFATLLVLLAK